MDKIIIINKDREEIQSIKKIINEIDPNYEIDSIADLETFREKSESIKPDIVFVQKGLKLPDGDNILKYYHDNYDNVIRILLTEHNDFSAVAEGSVYAHNIISKPLNKIKLNRILTSKSRLSFFLQDNNLTSLINRISFLPTLPKVYEKLENELSNKNTSMQRVSEIISSDVSFTVKILQIVNSSFFGISNRVIDPISAVNYLGKNIIKSLLLYHEIYTQFKIDKKYKDYFEKMWIHSNKVGKYAEELIYEYSTDEYEMMENAYIAGLLHDIGKLVLFNLKGYPQDVFDLMKKKGIRLSKAEEEIYGVTHSEVGAYFLTLWGLPENIIDAVYQHNHYDKAEFDEHFSVPSAVFIANILESKVGFELGKIKSLKLGIHPNDWLKYLKENGLYY
jgi:putative nucleotidyltransferase with HDIG domain